jgi:recombination protein RecA
MTDHQITRIQKMLLVLKKNPKTHVTLLGSREHLDIASISTGSLGLDKALGIGGVPRGRIIEVYGPESGGKTTLALHMIREAQRAGGVAALVDAEHALDPGWAKKIGVDIDNLLISQPDCGEEALETVEAMVETGVDMVVIDSVAALVPRAELDGDMGAAQMGLQARLMSQAMRKLTAKASNSKTCVVFINQVREKIGIVFGNPEVTTGGRALKFYSTVRIDVRRGKFLGPAENPFGVECRVKVVKNKIAPPFRSAMYNLYYDRGIDQTEEVFEMAAEMGIIKKSSSWYSDGVSIKVQGIDAFAKAYTEKYSDAGIAKLREQVLSGELPIAASLSTTILEEGLVEGVEGTDWEVVDGKTPESPFDVEVSK